MKYYIIAGEASGDLLGSLLMKALLRKDPSADIRFWGGDLMTQQGGTRVRHIKELAIMGFVEVMMHLHTVLGNISFCKKDIKQFAPDAIIYIDYPGFNLKIAHWAKKHSYRNYHYVSPQLWAWKKNRIHSMRRDLDALYYILPFEQQFYAQNNFPQAQYVGHPLLDAVQSMQQKPVESPIEQEATKNMTVAPQILASITNRKIIALLPGSRKQELKKMLPPMITLAKAHPEYQFEIAGMTLLGDAFYQPYIQKAHCDNISVVYNDTYGILNKAYAAIVCSGTATLETALFNVPQVVCYKASALSIAIARWFVANRIKYISLVNLIADKAVVCELIQNDLTEKRLELEFQKIVTDGPDRDNILSGYQHLHDLLGGAGTSDRVADAIVKSIKH
ncbi:MAG: lipid-A-disaccharide synthase [Bacteroidales bacterium]|nr:lipid-A-disaccharide synthase [Candidatus Colimorpha onthohippi]